MVSRASGLDIHDPSGLGRWSGVTFAGENDQKMSIITAYRSCAGSARSASMGSTFMREQEYLQDIGHVSKNPRRAFLWI